MRLETREMTAGDYDEVFRLWESAEGVGLTDADSREGVEKYLDRNPGLGLVACQEGQIIGTILGGHDGRRGYLHHMAVAPQHRRRGIGSALVRDASHGLRHPASTNATLGFIRRTRTPRSSWRKIGWSERADLVVMSREIR